VPMCLLRPAMPARLPMTPALANRESARCSSDRRASRSASSSSLMSAAVGSPVMAIPL